jgi:hypothetical protein
VGVRSIKGEVTWREVAPGLTDGTSLEVASGLSPGEAVLVESLPSLTEGQRRMFAIAPPPAVGGRPPRRRTALAASLLSKLAALPADRAEDLDRLGLTDPERAILREFAGTDAFRKRSF